MKRKISTIIACVLLIIVSIAIPVSGDPPYQPSNPNPAHGATGVFIYTSPGWTGGDPDGDPVTYDVYFGTVSPPPPYSYNQSVPYITPGRLEFGTIYYWRIVAWDNNSLFNSSPIWSFTTEFNDPPYQPSNPNPANGATGVNIDTDLSWTGGDPDGNPVTYDVYFGTTSPPPLIYNNLSLDYVDLGLLDIDTTYYWQITSWDSYAQFNTSPIWDFTTRSNTPPDQASNPSPTNNSIDIPRNTDLSWTGGDPDPYDSVTYDVYFGTDLNPLIIATSYSFTTFDIPYNLDYSTQYYWRVNTLDSYGAETAGPIWTFTVIDGNPPDTPNHPGPANNSIDVSIGTILNWTSSDPDIGDIITYDVHFGTTSPPPMVVNNQSANTYNPSTLNPDTTYYWQIKAWDDYGYSSTGPIWTFNTVVNNPPETPSNPSPIDNSIDVLTNVDLSWTGGDPDPFDSVTYDVFLGTDPNPPLVSSDQTTTTYDPGILDFDTQYYWRILAEDNFGSSNSSLIWTFTTEVYSNDPPVRPNAPNGPSIGKQLQSHTYTASTTDPDGDPVYYRFDWDDGQVSKWMGPYVSGREASASHTWLLQGTYGVKVQARDDRFAMSEWSDPFPIMMPRNNLFSHHPLFMFFSKFLEQHPNLFPILRILLGLYL